MNLYKFYKKPIILMQSSVKLTNSLASSRNPIINQSNQSSKAHQPIFNEQTFKVEDMSNPMHYLPQYQQNNQQEESCVKQCNICCGNICIGFAYTFVLCCCKCSPCIYELSSSQAGLVEQFGKFNRLLIPGFNLINPCTEQVTQIDMRIKLLSAGTNQCITKDNVKLSLSSSVGYRVTNPIIANYILGNNLNTALIQLTATSIRESVGSQLLQQVLSNRMKIVMMAKQLIKQSMPPGIQIQTVFLQNIQIPYEIVQDLSSAAKQRRISQARIINSQADVETAQLMKQSAELLDTKAAMQIRYLELVEDLGKRGVTIILPIGNSEKGLSY